jgi:hypothetical protein
MAGTYLQSLTVVQDNKVAKDEIITVAAGVLNAEIVSQENYASQDAFGIIVVAKVDVDTSLLETNIKQFVNDKFSMDVYQKSQKRIERLLKKIKQLEAENEKLKILSAHYQKEKKEQLKTDFAQTSKGLKANDWTKKAFSLWEEQNARYTNIN